MRTILYILFVLIGVQSAAQRNCNVYPSGSKEQTACWQYSNGCDEPQGSKPSQQYFDSAISVCPTFALAWYEKSVPYLKRGDFKTWRELLDKAVELEPKQYLADRGWCLFKFLKDYNNALADLLLVDSLRQGVPSHTGDDEYDLRILIALSYRELGDTDNALIWFGKSISDQRSAAKHGNYDYLHRAITLYRMGRFNEAALDIEEALKVYPQLADAHYYKALLLIKTGSKELAMTELSFAKANYEAGFDHYDPYTELIDRVYLEDIDKAISSLSFELQKN